MRPAIFEQRPDAIHADCANCGAPLTDENHAYIRDGVAHCMDCLEFCELCQREAPFCRCEREDLNRETEPSRA